MNYLKKSLMGLVFGSLVISGVAQAVDVAVIVNRSNPEALSIEQLKNIYSDRVTTWRSGQRIEIYALPSNQDAAETFAQRVLGTTSQTAAKANARRKLTNTLKNPIKTKRERLVVSIVGRKRNAIGYVPEYLVKGKKNVRVVKILKE